MRGGATLMGALVWVLTVVVAAAVTWQVIDAAGRDVLAEPLPSPATEATQPSSPTPSRAGDSGRPQDKPVKRPSRSATPTAGPTTSAAATRGPSGGHSPRTETSPSGSPTPADPTSATTSPADPTAETVRRTWHGAAGTMVVQCSDGAIELRGATPTDGYRVEVEEERDAVEVTFKRDEPEVEVKVRATCSDGAPRFEVEGEGRDLHD